MIGKKIKYYRLKKGLTIEELARAIGCTKASISLYENGEREPSEEICKIIANVLDIPWTTLLSRKENELVFNHIGFRKKQKASKKEIELLKMDIEEKCADRITLMNIIGSVNFKAFNAKQLSFDDDVSINSEIIRKELGIPKNGPIYSITNILEHAGIIVLSFECADEIDGINGMVNDIPYIFFNSKNRSIERQRFTIAHEMCHLFLNESIEEREEKDIEKYINKLAGNVLIPSTDIYMLFGKTMRKITTYLRDDVARVYRIAPSCLLTRLREENVISENYYKNYFISLNANGGKKNEKTLLDPIRDLEVPTFFTQQVYLALSSELITASKAAEFLHVPLYDVMNNMRVE